MSFAATLTYDLIVPRQIVFGWGRRREVGPLARSLGRRAFVVSGSRAMAERGVIGELFDGLRAAGSKIGANFIPLP